jgi:fructosamine-3-kinase
VPARPRRATRPLSLANPERSWAPPVATRIERSEVERRIGAFEGDVEVLGGGLANTNVRVGGRVLRIYRRDRHALPKEAALLERGWHSFRVPRVLGRGEDFLLLEELVLVPLDDTAEDGARAGHALAEIHSVKPGRSGFLDAELSVREPFDDVFSVLRDHALGCLERRRDLREEVRRFVERHEAGLREAMRDPVLLHADFKASNIFRCGESLVVLDWEFAWSGPALMDVGQLFRWGTSEEFASAFAQAYGRLAPAWRRCAEDLDLFNLAGLLERVERGSRRERDVVGRIRRTLATSS